MQLALVFRLVERRRAVQRAAVVPHDGVTVAPWVAVEVFRLGYERGQFIQQFGALLWRHADDLLRV